MLTQQRLKELLHYNPNTGVWTWLVTRNHLAKMGDVAGGVRDQGRYKGWFISVDNRQYPASRLAFLYMTGKWPKGLVDHENGQELDCRWTNLREATYAQNSQNQGVRKNNTSGVSGVHEISPGKWRARIGVNRKRIDLGVFGSKDEAVAARQDAVKKHFGEFARQ